MPKPLPQPAPRPAGRAIKQAVFALLFTVILQIPRVRRLRRNVRLWTAIRIGSACAGALLALLVVESIESAWALAPGLLLVAFAILARARPERKSTDAVARDLQGLVVLNGGTFLNPASGKHCRHASLLVNAERVIVLAEDQTSVGEIPLASLRGIDARPAGKLVQRERGASWELDLLWESGHACFRYEGFFAEHLARVAEKTLNSVRKRELPVLKM